MVSLRKYFLFIIPSLEGFSLQIFTILLPVNGKYIFYVVNSFCNMLFVPFSYMNEIITIKKDKNIHNSVM